MIKVTISSNGTITNEGTFATQAAAQAWYDSHLNTFGVAAHSYTIQVEVTPAVFESQEVLNAEGLSFDPPQFVEVEKLAATFADQTIHVEGHVAEFTDITNKLEQDRIQSESLKYLADTDYLVIREMDSGILCPLEVKAARAEARAKIVR